MQHKAKLYRTKEIVDFVQSLSYFIEWVEITKVENQKFYFEVKVPVLFRLVFGYFLKNKINRELNKRLPIGITFEFVFCGKELF